MVGNSPPPNIRIRGDPLPTFKLEALKLEGEVQVRQLPNGEAVYSLVHEDQHHLTCVNCGQSFPIDQCPVHDLEEKLETSHHFKVYYHTLEFFGLCHLCQVGD